MPKTYRAAVIGATTKGGYGHGLDTCFQGIPNIELVAIADDDPTGLKAAGQKLNVTRLYGDYREMITRERPDLISIGPRWVTDRLAMVSAAADAGCHIYCEKPLAGDVPTADALLAACRKTGVKLAVAHQFRGLPTVQKMLADLKAGRYGTLLRIWARPKDDRRGGGEELMVHGTHLCDLMIAVAGSPRWVSGHVGVGDRDATREDKGKATEPLGPIAGNTIAATFGFDRGVRGFFDTTVNCDRPEKSLYGLQVETDAVRMHVRSPGDVWVYPAAQVIPENPKFTWERIWIEDWHFTPEHKPRPTNDWIARSNRVLVQDLVAAIDENREPLSSGKDAHDAIEMIQGVYASHFQHGARLPFPLVERTHPLGDA